MTLLPDDIDALIERANAEIAARPRIEAHPTPMDRVSEALRALLVWAVALAITVVVVGGATWLLYAHPGLLAWIWRI